MVVDGPVSARRVGRALELRNTGAEPIYYHAMGRMISARADGAVCRVPSRCPAVAPGDIGYVSFRDILFDERGEQEISLSWWHLIPAGDGLFRPDSIRGLILPL